MVRFLLLIFILINPHIANASGSKDITSFATLPILHEGRIKPIDSFARAKLTTLSGHESLQNMGAADWLLEVLFDPASSASRPVFKIRNPDLLGMLSLEKKDLYSFSELLPKVMDHRDIIASILAKPHEEWTQSQSDLILLQQEMAILEQLMGSLSSLLPLAIDIPPDMPDYLKDFTGKPISYRDTLKFREQLDADLKEIIKTKGEDVTKYTQSEQILALLSFTADQVRIKGAGNFMLKILPQGDGINWISPWQTLDQGNPAMAELITLWQNLAKADDTKTWNQNIDQIKTQTYDLGNASIQRISIEYTYNLLHPHETSFALYTLALMLACGGVLLNKKILLGASGITLLLGVIIHILGIAARIYILQRPPVSTLYETILFVGGIVVLYGLVLWFKKRDTTCLIGTGLIGIVLHILGFTKIGEGDSMVMLDAALNTQFWLATHVLCITTGYAFCLVASAFAHYKLAVQSPPSYINTSMHTTALLSLFFTTVGTILGGIWADQSWGRFWGWDPKENGAMLITLWLIWVLHGRISGQMGPLFFQAMLAYLSVIVALSWFGVNLLGVGLHAYGFTDSLAFTLGLFIAFETILIGALWWRAARHAA